MKKGRIKSDHNYSYTDGVRESDTVSENVEVLPDITLRKRRAIEQVRGAVRAGLQ